MFRPFLWVDIVVWLPTTIQYQRVGTSGGVTGTHWRQTTSTGNARKVVDFDQRMRPVLTRDYDTANAATTDRYIRRRFDHANRETFVSYPAVSEAGTTAGAQTTYALGRVIATQQDSELGVLGTSTVYANPFKTVHELENGRLQVRTTVETVTNVEIKHFQKAPDKRQGIFYEKQRPIIVTCGSCLRV